jgi:hypothetical protein
MLLQRRGPIPLQTDTVGVSELARDEGPAADRCRVPEPVRRDRRTRGERAERGTSSGVPFGMDGGGVCSCAPAGAGGVIGRHFSA